MPDVSFFTDRKNRDMLHTTAHILRNPPNPGGLKSFKTGFLTLLQKKNSSISQGEAKLELMKRNFNLDFEFKF